MKRISDWEENQDKPQKPRRGQPVLIEAEDDDLRHADVISTLLYSVGLAFGAYLMLLVLYTMAATLIFYFSQRSVLPDALSVSQKVFTEVSTELVGASLSLFMSEPLRGDFRVISKVRSISRNVNWLLMHLLIAIAVFGLIGYAAGRLRLNDMVIVVPFLIVPFTYQLLGAYVLGLDETSISILLLVLVIQAIILYGTKITVSAAATER